MILHNAFLNRFYSFATFIESYKRLGKFEMEPGEQSLEIYGHKR